MKENYTAIELELQQKILPVEGNKDYEIYSGIIFRIEEILKLGSLERIVIEKCISEKEIKRKEYAAQKGKKQKGLRKSDKKRISQVVIKAFRCTIARHLTGEAYRAFSCRLADSHLLQSFCMIRFLEKVKVPSKSTLERYEKMIPLEAVEEVIHRLNQAGMEEDEKSQQLLDLEKAISMANYYVDTTCVEANIHYPIDWVLFRDGIRTMVKGIMVIREKGLKHRMSAPKSFISEINKLCIKMAGTRRQKDSKRKRKAVLREMKKLLKKVEKHAKRHIILLEEKWKETDLDEAEKDQIVNRIKNILDQLPGVVHQAHERIIGERAVAGNEKILSLYEPMVHVIIRKKAGAEVEFGNTLILAEQEDGLIIDWQLCEEKAPNDTKLLAPSLKRIEKIYNGYQPDQVTGDRGFDSPKNATYLNEKEIVNNICPRSVKKLEEKLLDKEFCNHQRRRSQTEARIGIFKNQFLGKPLRNKGFASRNLGVVWSILSHNLWVFARLPKAQNIPLDLPLAA